MDRKFDALNELSRAQNGGHVQRSQRLTSSLAMPRRAVDAVGGQQSMSQTGDR